jgi:hypothetical protein
MFVRNVICGLLALGCLSACVTETKPEDHKPYVAQVPTEVAVKTVIPERGEGVAGSIVVKCRVKYDSNPSKTLLCGPSTIMIINELSKSSKDFSFSGDKIAIPVAKEASYAVELKTKGCDKSRIFSGLTVGMVLSALFENCGGAVK